MKSTSNAAHAASNALFKRYQEGDTSALAELYNCWNAYITKRITESNAFSCVSDIEDVTSDVWIRVQENAAKWDINRSSWFKFLDYKIKKSIAEACRKRDTLKRRTDHEAYRVNPANDDSDQTDIIEQIASDEPTPLNFLLYNEQVETLKRAIAACEFSNQKRQVLKLRLQGLTTREIQSRLGMKSKHQVNTVLNQAVSQLRTVINPKTYEIQPNLTPQQHLATLGLQLAELCRKRKWGPLRLAETLNIRPDALTAFIEGDRKPHAPLLKKMATCLGEKVYDIYAPPVSLYPYSLQGRQLWYARVRIGRSARKLAYQINVGSSAITAYEIGKNRPSEKRLTQIVETLHAPQLLEVYA